DRRGHPGALPSAPHRRADDRGGDPRAGRRRAGRSEDRVAGRRHFIGHADGSARGDGVMRAIVAALALLAACAGPARAASLADSTARPISLTEALEMAQKSSPQAIQARNQTKTAAAGSRPAVAAFLPNVNLSAGATRQYTSGSRTRIENGQVITVPSDPWSYSAGFGANVELFTGGRRLFDIQGARGNVRVAEANETIQRYQVALLVKQQYFNVLAARESEDAALAQLTQAQQALRVALIRVRA